MSAPVIKLTVAVALVAGSLNASGPAVQPPQLSELLTRTGTYLADYATRVSGVTLEEQYQLIQIVSGKMQPPVRIASDVVLVNANGGIAALRDVYALDTRPTRERTPRITALLAAPAPTMADWNRAVRFPQEGALHFGIDIIVKVNEPTMALRFIALAAQPDLKYKLDGKKKINGVEVLGIGFEEPIGPDKKYSLGTRRNARAFGRIWVDPATGAVHQTELWVESKGEQASASVKYAPHKELNLLLPAETTETYEEREFGGEVRDFQGAGASQIAQRFSFQASAKYSKATRTPIDLRKLIR